MIKYAFMKGLGSAINMQNCFTYWCCQLEPILHEANGGMQGIKIVPRIYHENLVSNTILYWIKNIVIHFVFFISLFD